MSHLLIIRHTTTQPLANVPNQAWNVTPEGLERAAQLADRLRRFAIGALYTSTQDKTKITGQLLAERLAVADVEALPQFDENDRRGVPFYDSQAAFFAAIETYFAQPDEVVFGTESAKQVAARFANGVEQVLSISAEKSIAIVTHGVAPSCWLAAHMQREPFDVWRQIQQLGMPCTFIFSRPDLHFVEAFGV